MKATALHSELSCRSGKPIRPECRWKMLCRHSLPPQVLPSRRLRLRTSSNAVTEAPLCQEKSFEENNLSRKAHLLLVDDDPSTLASLSRAFRLAGHEATVCDNASRALELLRDEAFDLILSDVMMPGKSGIEFLEELKKAGVKTPVVLVSGQANIEMAVRATKLGAMDFLEKPLSTDKLLVTLENALRLSRLQEENRQLRDRLGKHELVGSSPAMTKLLAQIDRVAPSETRVCILGETGTGKELVARAIHEKSA